MLGKVGCDEFAMGSSNETSFGEVINPWSKVISKNFRQVVLPEDQQPSSLQALHLQPQELIQAGQ